MDELTDYHKEIKEKNFRKELYKNIDKETKRFLKILEKYTIEENNKKRLECYIYTYKYTESYGMRIIYKDKNGQFILLKGEKKYVKSTKFSQHGNIIKIV